MVVDAIGGRDPEILANLRDGGRIALVTDGMDDKIEDFPLPIGKPFGHVHGLRMVETQ